MTAQNDVTFVETPTKSGWRQRLVLPMLIVGGLLTVTWIAVLIGLAWQIASAVAGMGTHP